MASNRLERIGTIFTRVQGLLRSGAMKSQEKPIWYEVYEAFPPAYQPMYGRKAPTDVSIRKILYTEDMIRAKYWKKFGSPTTINLTDARKTIPSQIFVEKYREMEKDFSDDDELFDAVANVLEAERNKKSSKNQPSSFVSILEEVATSSEKSKLTSEDIHMTSNTAS